MAKVFQFFVDVDDNVGGNSPPRIAFGVAPVAFPEAHLNGRRFRVVLTVNDDGTFTNETQEMVRPAPEPVSFMGRYLVPGK